MKSKTFGQVSLLYIAVLLLLVLAVSGCGSNNASSPAESSEETQVEAVGEDPTAYDAQIAMRQELEDRLDTAITFYGTVRNDDTGNWRLACLACSVPIEEYAVDYYNAFFSSDEEIHGVVNFTLGTTSCLTVYGNTLFIDVHEYVDGEEHDAKALFGGQVLAQFTVDLETGAVEEV